MACVCVYTYISIEDIDIDRYRSGSIDRDRYRCIDIYTRIFRAVCAVFESVPPCDIAISSRSPLVSSVCVCSVWVPCVALPPVVGPLRCPPLCVGPLWVGSSPGVFLFPVASVPCLASRSRSRSRSSSPPLLRRCPAVALRCPPPVPSPFLSVSSPPLLRRCLSLCTILPSPILYDLWYTKGGSVGGCILRNCRGILLQ